MSLSTKSIRAIRECATRKIGVVLPPNELESLCDLALRDPTAAPEHIRWPAPAFDHAAWFASLREGDRVEWRFAIGWTALTVAKAFRATVTLRKESGELLSTGICDRIRPLPAATVTKAEHERAEELDALRNALVTIRQERDRQAETIAAKDVEIAEAKRIVAGYLAEYDAHEKTIAELRAALGVRAGRITQQDRVNEGQAKTIGDLRATIARLEGESGRFGPMFDAYQQALVEAHAALGVGWSKRLSESGPAILAAIAELKAEIARHVAKEKVDGDAIDRLTSERDAHAQRAALYQPAGNYLTDVCIALGVAIDPSSYKQDGENALKAIASLRASALVVPEEVAAVAPLPWRTLGDDVLDVNMHFVCTVSSRIKSPHREALASAIVQAANAAGGVVIIFCPFCRKCPTINDADACAPLYHSISCCGLTVDCPTSAGTQRRWNEIAKSVLDRRAWLVRRRAQRTAKAKPGDVSRALFAAARALAEVRS